MRRFLFLGLIVILALGLLLSTGAMADPPNEGDSPASSSLNTEYFTIMDPGGGAQPSMTYTDSQTHETGGGLMEVCLQDVGVNPDPTPPSWADDIANVYVDGNLIGTYDSLNNPEPAPGPGPVQCFTTLVEAGSHEVLAEVTYSWVAGSMFAKEIDVTPIVEVEKDYRFTNVCFEQDNDNDGLFNEDPVNFVDLLIDGMTIVPIPIDDDGDGLYNEDDVDCPMGTYLGDELPMDDDNYVIEAVIKKNGKVSSYNPGQYYAVSTVNVLMDVDTLTIKEDWCDCLDISALSPEKGGGSVVIVEVVDGVARQILDAKSDDVSFGCCIGCCAEAVLEDVAAGTTIMMYVKFGPAQKHAVFDPGDCENFNSVIIEGVTVGESSAMLELVAKE
jgi:hypothetical protein